MARYFLDSSALVKRYHQESGTADVDELFAASGNRLLISRLAIVEVHSALARLVRETVIGATDFDKVVARLTRDVASGELTVVAVSSARLEGALTLIRLHGLTNQVRTLDAIHLATALALDTRSRIANFVSADKKQLAIAVACGLSVQEIG